MDCNFKNGKKQAWRNSGFSGIRIHAFQIIFGCFYELSYEVTHWELTRQLHCLTLHRPLTASLYSRTQTFSHASSTRGLLFLTGSLCSRTRFLAGSHNSRTQTFSRASSTQGLRLFRGPRNVRVATLGHLISWTRYSLFSSLIPTDSATDYVGEKKRLIVVRGK